MVQCCARLLLIKRFPVRPQNVSERSLFNRLCSCHHLAYSRFPSRKSQVRITPVLWQVFMFAKLDGSKGPHHVFFSFFQLFFQKFCGIACFSYSRALTSERTLLEHLSFSALSIFHQFGGLKSVRTFCWLLEIYQHFFIQTSPRLFKMSFQRWAISRYDKCACLVQCNPDIATS